MNALVLEGPNRFCYRERVPVPCGPDQVRVKIEAVAICGSDAGAILGKTLCSPIHGSWAMRQGEP